MAAGQADSSRGSPARPALASVLDRAMDDSGTAAAIGVCEARIAEDPADALAFRYLGQILAARGEFLPALRAATRACELAPDDARSWSDLGRVHATAGELQHAVRCFDEAITIDVRFADGWHNLGVALRKLGRRESAFGCLKNALLIEPARADTWLVLGSLLIESAQYKDALECFKRAAQHDPSMARARSRLGEQLSRRGRSQRAEVLFRQSLGLDPDHVEGWLGLARTLEDLGQADGARAAYLNVLRRRPDHALALGNYLALTREAGGDDAQTGQWMAMADDLLANEAVKDEARALIGYGLAKYHDRARNPAAAARAGIAANAARRRGSGALDRAALEARVDGLIALCDRDFFVERRRHGIGTDQPVFIVGLPRSGTTLVEQIVSAHPLLHGAGELPDLARLAVKVAGDDREPWEAAGLLDQAASRVTAGQYLKALRQGAPRRRLRISDKSPLNFFHLAFTAVLFPGARVIHCRRSPRDTALSIWMENFNAEQRYATDFDDLAFFHAQYERLMAHWGKVLPLPVLEVQYERTVEDVEAQARRLLDFLHAPWDSRCLEFHRNARSVQTPSRWQVRQPIYRGSVERWRRYGEYLPELLRAFPREEA
jgi:tetratricopeptide (TPR) repeat protein